MNIEPIEQRLIAHSTEWVTGMERAERATKAFEARVAHLLTTARSPIDIKVNYTALDAANRALLQFEAQYERTATKVAMQGLKVSMGLAGDWRGADPNLVRQMQYFGLIPPGASASPMHVPGLPENFRPNTFRGAAPFILQDLRQRGLLPPLPPIQSASSMHIPGLPDQYRPDVFGRQYELDRRMIRATADMVGSGRGRGGGAVGGGGSFASSAWGSNIISAILGGVGGRFFGGQAASQFGAAGGYLGSAIGGPAGGLAGAGAGVAVGAGFNIVSSVIDKVKDVGISAFHMLAKAIMEAGEAAVHLGVEFQKSVVMYGILTGDKAKGSQLFGQLKAMSTTTPYGLEGLSSNAQVLLGYGVKSEQIPNMLSRLGDLAVGNPDKLRRLSLAYGQVLTHGRLLGQEARQLAELGVGVKDIAGAGGMSTAELRELMRGGGASPNLVTGAINALTNPVGRFFGASKGLMEDTISGQWKNLMARGGIALGEFGEKGMGQLGVSGGIKDLGDVLDAQKPRLDAFLDWLERATNAADPFITTLHLIRDSATDAFSRISDATPKFEELQGEIREFAITTVTLFDMMKEAILAIPEAVSLAAKAFRIVNPAAAVALGNLGLAVPPHVRKSYFEMREANERAFDIEQGQRNRGRNFRKGKSIYDSMVRSIWGGETSVTPEIALGDYPGLGKEDEDVVRFREQMERQSRSFGGRTPSPYAAYQYGMGMTERAFPKAFGVGSPIGMFPEALSGYMRGMIPRGPEYTLSGPALSTDSNFSVPKAARWSSFGAGQISSLMGAILPGVFQAVQGFRDQANLIQFKELERSLPKVSERLTPAMEFGSSEAMDAINRSSDAQLSVLEQVRSVLEQANTYHQQIAERNAEIVEALKALQNPQAIK